MNTRLQQFLSAENLSQSQLADMLGVARASVSHIIAGRNKPGYDFIESLVAHYPTLNIDWLITGRGRMYKNSAPSLFDDSPSEPSIPSPVRQFDTAQPTREEIRPSAVPADNCPKTASNVSRIVVFYSDGRFKELDI